MSSPIFTRNENFNNPDYSVNSFSGSVLTNETTGQMTVENTIRKSVGLFIVLLVSAVAGWFVVPSAALPVLAILALGIGLFAAFKKEPAPFLYFTYATVAGALIGSLSFVLDLNYPGIASQAVLATVSVFAVTLVLFRNGKIRATPKLTRFFIIATVGYLLFSVLNFGLMLFGATDAAWGLRSFEIIPGLPIGIIIGLFAIALATYSLILDFDFIQKGVANKIEEKYGWMAGFGLLVTVVWMYVEIIRLLSFFQGD